MFSHQVVSDSATPWAIAHQAPLSIGFSSQEYWSRLPFLFRRDLPNQEIKPVSPVLAGRFFTTEPPGKPQNIFTYIIIYKVGRVCNKMPSFRNHVKLFVILMRHYFDIIFSNSKDSNWLLWGVQKLTIKKRRNILVHFPFLWLFHAATGAYVCAHKFLTKLRFYFILRCFFLDFIPY